MSATTTPTIECTDLRSKLESGSPPRLLDVRTPGEFENVHIPGAYNVPLHLLNEHRDDILHHLDDDVVVMCQAGPRSAQAGEALRAAGLVNVQVLEGGIADWQQKGYPVNRGAQRWDLERQVRLVAGSLVLASVLGSIAVPALKWFAAGVGGGLTYAAVTNSCAMGTMLAKLPYNRGSGCDAQSIIAALAEAKTDRA
jgi:rhodanese-related sulfurtransferase